MIDRVYGTNEYMFKSLTNNFVAEIAGGKIHEEGTMLVQSPKSESSCQLFNIKLC
jgi:hypothetical protein